jgi:hypothetical protein
VSRGRAKFREADISRVLRAARKAGAEVTVEIDPDNGRIVVTTKTAKQDNADDNATERWLAKHAHQR